MTTLDLNHYALDGTLTGREQWTDQAPAGYTSWDASGNISEQRPLTPDEQAMLAADAQVETETANRTAIEQKADAALAANIASLAKPDPTSGLDAIISANPSYPLSNAVQKALVQAVQTLATNQKAIYQALAGDAGLLRQNNMLIRLDRNFLDTTDGT